MSCHTKVVGCHTYLTNNFFILMFLLHIWCITSLQQCLIAVFQWVIISLDTGAPSEEFLSQEITSSDHTFLRAAVPSIQAHRRAVKGGCLQSVNQDTIIIVIMIIYGNLQGKYDGRYNEDLLVALAPYQHLCRLFFVYASS